MDPVSSEEMSINNSIDLYFKIEDIESALHATAGIAAHLDMTEHTPLILPDGRVIEVPFTSGSDEVILKPHDSTGSLDTSIWFAVDDAIRDYQRANFGIPASMSEEKKRVLQLRTKFVEEKELFSIGIIYLHIEVGKQYAEFSYVSLVNDMSRLFVASQSVQEAFLQLLKEAHGLFGLMYIEDDDEGGYPLLGSTDKRVFIDAWETALSPTNGLRNIDKFVEAGLKYIHDYLE
jgi:hypothetical protein